MVTTFTFVSSTCPQKSSMNASPVFWKLLIFSLVSMPPESQSQCSPLSITTWAVSPQTGRLRSSPSMVRATIFQLRVFTLLVRLLAPQCTVLIASVPTLSSILLCSAEELLNQSRKTTLLARYRRSSLTELENNPSTSLTTSATQRDLNLQP
jgi:hypothetical protein